MTKHLLHVSLVVNPTENNIGTISVKSFIKTVLKVVV